MCFTSDVLLGEMLVSPGDEVEAGDVLALSLIHIWVYSWYVSPKTGNRVNLKVRFGESVSEAMTPYPEKGSTNDHANRDMVLNVGFLSANETNDSGFRFVNIELMDDDASIELYMIQGVMIGRELKKEGSFACSDARINDIYETAVYTAYLNMQESVSYTHLPGLQGESIRHRGHAGILRTGGLRNRALFGGGGRVSHQYLHQMCIRDSSNKRTITGKKDRMFLLIILMPLICNIEAY